MLSLRGDDVPDLLGGIWPQLCGGAPGPAGSPSPPSASPENIQIDWALPSAPVGSPSPLPLTSPALAVPAAPASRIALANTVAAVVRRRNIPPDVDGAETVLETGWSGACTAPFLLLRFLSEGWLLPVGLV